LCRKEQLENVEEETFQRPDFEDTEPDIEFKEDDDVDFPRSFVASIYTRQGRIFSKIEASAFSIWVDKDVYKQI
jgi:hypothetical protein